jgi:hypothetical protein
MRMRGMVWKLPRRVKVLMLVITGLFLWTGSQAGNNKPDTSAHSTQAQALAYLATIQPLKASAQWPNVNPVLFLQNLNDDVNNPLSIYEGRGTNFCSYAALSYIPVHYDPLGYVKFMLKLYNDGTATMGEATFYPTAGVYKGAGSLRYKGALDNRPADQMWFLVLADHFKGYLNYIDQTYDPGDENGFWASTNYAKFNRMVKKLFNFHVETLGSDLFRPSKRNLVDYIEDRLKTGVLFLFVNNTQLTKKNHRPKKKLPSHYIVLQRLERSEKGNTIVYWDYGSRTLQQVSSSFLQAIIFGVTHCTPKTAHAQ